MANTVLPRIQEHNFTELDHRLEWRVAQALGHWDGSGRVLALEDISRTELYDRLETIVGNTPLIHVEDVGDSSILAKVESQNPTENHYDRVFPRTIRQLERDKVIAPGDELVEVTSGSGGRAFAFAARVLGYKARIIIPPELPAARVQDLKNLGAEITVTEPGYMSAASQEYVGDITKLKRGGYVVTKHETPLYTVFTAEKDGKKVCFVNHSANELTVQGFETIGDEVARQLPEGEKVDFVVSVMGNGTSTTALSRSMRHHFPGVQVVGIEDERSPYYFAMKYPGEYERRYGKPADFQQHDMYGSSAPGVKLKYGTTDTVDQIRLANHLRRDIVKREYNRNRKNFERIGNSSAASLEVARELAIEHQGARIVVVFYDKADQYGDSTAIASNLYFRDFLKRVPEGVPHSYSLPRRAGSIALMPRSVESAYSHSW